MLPSLESDIVSPDRTQLGHRLGGPPVRTPGDHFLTDCRDLAGTVSRSTRSSRPRRSWLWAALRIGAQVAFTAYWLVEPLSRGPRTAWSLTPSATCTPSRRPSARSWSWRWAGTEPARGRRRFRSCGSGSCGSKDAWPMAVHVGQPAGETSHPEPSTRVNGRSRAMTRTHGRTVPNRPARTSARYE